MRVPSDAVDVLAVPSDLAVIARTVVSRSWSDEDWAAHESDDEFHMPSVIGGFDATERAFCFSVYEGDTEWWVQLTSGQIAEIAAGRLLEVDARPAG